MGDAVDFPEEEARHVTRVLRLGVGDGIQWLDGRGGRYRGRVVDLDRRRLRSQVEAFERAPAPRPLHLYVGALHDAARLEWLVEKATELGASSIALVRTARVQRTRYRIDRLRAKAIAALKQSGRVWLPPLTEPTYGAVVAELAALDPSRRVLIAHCDRSRPRVRLGALLTATDAPPAGDHLLIGPEGDFTTGEIDAAEAAGATAVSLGDARLRTETATLAALALLTAR